MPVQMSRTNKAMWGLVALALTLAAVLAPLGLGVEHRVACLWLALALHACAVAICGVAVRGSPWGIFVDSRNRVSLSRLQAVVWMIILVGGLCAAVMTNVARGDRDPTDVTIPPALLILAGISAASMVGSPLIKSKQRDESAAQPATAMAAEAKKAGRDVSTLQVVGTLVVNDDIDQASWTDLIEGEQTTNFATIDIGKVQMLAVTLLTASVYVAALVQLFADPDVALVGKLPDITDGMNVLLGISHTGYLATKGVPRKSTSPEPPVGIRS